VLTRVGPWLHLSPDRIQHAQAWIQRWGPYALPVAYFLPGVRHVAALLTGASGLSLPRFARFAYTGAVLWCGTFIGIGYGFGAEWSRLSPSVQRTAIVLALVVVSAMAVLLLILWRKNQRSTHV
jgi:membrane protein DedA with SNARE-associated domain